MGFIVRSVVRRMVWGFVAYLACISLLVWPGYGAEESASEAWPAASMPDFSGIWARSTFGWELRSSEPGPLKNLRRRPNGASDAQMLVGDYTSPILKPRAAEIVKKHGEISQ